MVERVFGWIGLLVIGLTLLSILSASGLMLAAAATQEYALRAPLTISIVACAATLPLAALVTWDRYPGNRR